MVMPSSVVLPIFVWSFWMQKQWNVSQWNAPLRKKWPYIKTLSFKKVVAKQKHTVLLIERSCVTLFWRKPVLFGLLCPGKSAKF